MLESRRFRWTRKQWEFEWKGCLCLQPAMTDVIFEGREIIIKISLYIIFENLNTIFITLSHRTPKALTKVKGGSTSKWLGDPRKTMIYNDILTEVVSTGHWSFFLCSQRRVLSATSRYFSSRMRSSTLNLALSCSKSSRTSAMGESIVDT